MVPVFTTDKAKMALYHHPALVQWIVWFATRAKEPLWLYKSPQRRDISLRRQAREDPNEFRRSRDDRSPALNTGVSEILDWLKIVWIVFGDDGVCNRREEHGTFL